MFSRIMVGAVLVLTALAGALAAPAQASPGGSVGVAEARYINLSATDNCPLGYFCAFEDLGILGRGVAFFGTEANWGAIPSEFRWINNRARSGWNNGHAGGLDTVFVYPLPNFQNTSTIFADCVRLATAKGDFGALRPESNRWVTDC